MKHLEEFCRCLGLLNAMVIALEGGLTHTKPVELISTSADAPIRMVDGIAHSLDADQHGTGWRGMTSFVQIQLISAQFAVAIQSGRHRTMVQRQWSAVRLMIKGKQNSPDGRSVSFDYVRRSKNDQFVMES
ncbi:membrane protein [Burkholderia lata]|uniref:hypothetical protein n=1 Tax=Burkholderia lata (strain ATCC 17760 / DSM 23089 / LMG 22485 / NCIMB 9086 / R18194 / 383) TaxID=482957 RepID=UPI001453F665|nr:hypothetical protein [Burkholderia lata]VWD63962.1 membrane protein [Burkholderia lata]